MQKLQNFGPLHNLLGQIFNTPSSYKKEVSIFLLKALFVSVFLTVIMIVIKHKFECVLYIYIGEKAELECRVENGKEYPIHWIKKR